jgi:hypothetical protein
MLSTKCGHTGVEGVHGPRHSIDKGWLIFICEAVDFICSVFDGFSLFYELIVAFDWFDATLQSLSVFRIT